MGAHAVSRTIFPSAPMTIGPRHTAALSGEGGIHRHATHAVILQGELGPRVQEGRAGVGEVHEERDGGAATSASEDRREDPSRRSRARLTAVVDLATPPFPEAGDDARHTGEALGDGGLLETARGRAFPAPMAATATRQHTKPSAHRRQQARPAAPPLRPSWKSLLSRHQQSPKFELD